MMDPLRFFTLSLSATFLILLSAGAKAESGESLRIFQGEYPRVFFFRQSEGMAASEQFSYRRWERTFDRLMGIEGKVLEEEVPGRSIRNIDFFTRFKKRRS